MAKDSVKNRRDVARHRQRRKERTLAIIKELLQFVKRDPLSDDPGKGYAYSLKVPTAFWERFEEMAAEYNWTGQQLADEAMAVFLAEKTRMHDEQN